MHREVYTDGIGEITVNGTIVRVDLMTLSPTERDLDGNPKSVFRERVIFSVEAFANSVELMQKALNGLIEAGAVRRADVAPGAPPAQAAAARRNGSPNFS